MTGLDSVPIRQTPSVPKAKKNQCDYLVLYLIRIRLEMTGYGYAQNIHIGNQ